MQAGNVQEAVKYAESALASMQEVMGMKVRRMREARGACQRHMSV